MQNIYNETINELSKKKNIFLNYILKSNAMKVSSAFTLTFRLCLSIRNHNWYDRNKISSIDTHKRNWIVIYHVHLEL